ncbi:DoxX family protein [Oleomonas cavernae]|nr:DoxX family protein [Oleomonas cavernae]
MSDTGGVRAGGGLREAAATAGVVLLPLGLLALRLGVGLVFWKSASTRFDGFGLSDSAISLFAEIYKVPLLPPEIAAYLGTAAEATGAWLLFLGLFTRFGAVILLGVTMMIQLVVPFTGDGIAFNAVEFCLWGGALLVLLVQGGGTLSADRLLSFVFGRH